MISTTRWRAAALLVCLVSAPHAVFAQDPAAPAMTMPAGEGWTWSVEGQAFGGYNYQKREFTDFDAWESQNWLMGQAARTTGDWRLTLTTMLSAEPFTLHAIGSPQAFQTGETFHNAPLIDYQHPHDLIMQLGGELTGTMGRATISVGAGLAGSPALGPAPFMHRPSASENPTAPLGHHYLDSTHISHGVLNVGLGSGPVRVTGSVFHGREPDENRKDLELGALDSSALQVAWATGPWSAQISTAKITRPERLSPYDTVKHTASVAYTRRGGEDRLLALLAAAGQNREAHGNLEAYLLEGTWRLSWRHAVYARAESVAKDILDAGFHPLGFHRHRQSQVGALTGGYVFDVARGRGMRVGLGGDVTVYGVAANLRDAYGSPVSYHVFVRVGGRTGSAASMPHVHH